MQIPLSSLPPKIVPPCLGLLFHLLDCLHSFWIFSIQWSQDSFALQQVCFAIWSILQNFLTILFSWTDPRQPFAVANFILPLYMIATNNLISLLSIFPNFLFLDTIAPLFSALSCWTGACLLFYTEPYFSYMFVPTITWIFYQISNKNFSKFWNYTDMVQ